MLDVFLRAAVFAISIGVIATFGQLAYWSVKPVHRWIGERAPYTWVAKYWTALAVPEEPVRVSIEPVGLIEGGKVRQVESKVLASRLKHRVEEIFGLLSREQAQDFKDLANSQIHLVGTVSGQPAERTVDKLELTISAQQKLDFKAQFFDVDVTGFANYVINRLDRQDRVRSMVDISGDPSRLYIEIDQVSGPARRIVEDGPKGMAPALDYAACAVARGYLEDDPRYLRMTTSEFCAYVRAVQEYRRFVTVSATRVRAGQGLDSVMLDEVIDSFKQTALAQTKAPAVKLQLAALYRLKGHHDTALANLEEAARIVPDHPFVEEHLAAWSAEKRSRVAQASKLAQAREAAYQASQVPEIAESEGSPLDGTYEAIRTQPALEAIRYPQMVTAAAPLIEGKLRVAALGTGFNPFDPPAQTPVILPVVSAVGEGDGSDLLGYGTYTAHLLAALLPFEQIEVLPVKVLDDNGTGQLRDILYGLELAAFQNNATVVAYPLGFSTPTGTTETAIRQLWDRLHRSGVTVVATAGNAGRESAVPDMLGWDGVLGVGASALQNGVEIAPFSPGPDGIDVFVPGVDVVSTLNGLDLEDYSGGGLAVMIAAALFSVGKAIDPALDTERFVALLDQTAQPATDGALALIDAEAFVTALAAERRP